MNEKIFAVKQQKVLFLQMHNVYEYSLNVGLHFVQRRNCVDDSSAPLVCTCQTYAVLLPHFGHSILTVGNVRSFCSSLLITATSCLGLGCAVSASFGSVFFSGAFFL